MPALSQTPRVGDSCVAWVGTANRGKHEQWLVQIKRAKATPAEIAKGSKHVTKYLSWGTSVTFDGAPEALELWIAGPVKMDKALDGENAQQSGKPVAIHHERTLVMSDYLRLGLDNSVRVDEFLRKRIGEELKADPKFSPGQIYSLEKPIKPENVKWAKPVAEKIGFTPEMAREWTGGYVALEAFYNLVNEVPSLREIAMVALDKPSVFKLAKLAFGANFKTYIGGPATMRINLNEVGLMPVGLGAYDAGFWFALDDDPIVAGAVAVTSPNPPIDTSAGIMAMIAVHPKDASRMVQLKIISAEAGSD
ncbi:MAG TPA: hypothetical protein VFT72_14090 [Opitutaceae bacterium]|nr:hypothetical protein [Opitutaceae bacterium]